MELAKLDVVKVGTGYRASKVIGSTVVTNANPTSSRRPARRTEPTR